MKKQTILLLFITCAALLSSCEDAYEPEASLSSVLITSSDILFGPRGGEGFISFRSGQSVSAWSEQPWCKVSVEDSLVSVVAGAYDGLENRYSSIILKSGSDSVKVVAQQNGVIMIADAEDRYVLANEKTEFAFSVEANSDVKVKSSAAWLRCSILENNVVISVRENDYGHIRTGWVEYSCGTLSDTVRVSQGTASDLYGNYRLYGYDAGNSLVYMPVAVSAGEEEHELKITCNAAGTAWVFKGRFDPMTHMVTFANADNVGDITISGHTFHVFRCLLSSLTSSFNWDPALSCSAVVSYDDEQDCTKIEIQPVYHTASNGTETLMDSWVFAAFQNIDEETSLPKGNASAYPAILYFPYFQSI